MQTTSFDAVPAPTVNGLRGECLASGYAVSYFAKDTLLIAHRRGQAGGVLSVVAAATFPGGPVVATFSYFNAAGRLINAHTGSLSDAQDRVRVCR